MDHSLSKKRKYKLVQLVPLMKSDILPLCFPFGIQGKPYQLQNVNNTNYTAKFLRVSIDSYFPPFCKKKKNKQKKKKKKE
jgi:hypothetical protein